MGIRFFFVYLLFFLLLFLPFPKSNALIGNTDAIGTLAVYRTNLLELREIVFHETYGNAFYPEKRLGDFVEEYWGETFFYGIISIPGFSDRVNIYLLISLLFALNGFSVFCLTHFYTKSAPASLLSGLSFSTCSYMLCNQEMINALAFFMVPFVLLFIERYFIEQKPKYLFYSVFALGMQFYFSSYSFVFGVLMVSVILLYNFELLLKLIGKHYKYYLVVIFTGVLITIPGIYSILFGHKGENVFNPLVELPGISQRYSLELVNFISSWPNNLIYKKLFLISDKALKNQYFANIGLAFVGFALLGTIKGDKRKLLFVFFTIISVLVSFGTSLEVAGTTIHMPLYWLYKINFIQQFYRIPGRTFVLTVFCLSVLFSFGLVYIQQHLRYYQPVFVSIMIVFILENAPFPFPIESGNATALVPPEEYVNFYTKQHSKVIAELPSSLFTERFQYVNGVSEYSREYRYMYWQTLHKNFVINGSGSFFPKSRMYNNSLTKDVSSGNNLIKLINYNNLDFITLHKSLVLTQEEETIEPFLKSSNLLDKILETDEVVIFEVKKDV